MGGFISLPMGYGLIAKLLYFAFASIICIFKVYLSPCTPTLLEYSTAYNTKALVTTSALKI